MAENRNNNKPIIILGAGRHAKVLIDLISKSGREILGVTDPGKNVGEDCVGVKVLGTDQKIFEYSPSEVELVNGLAEFNKKDLRIKITKMMEERGYFFTPVIHPSAVISSNVIVSQGVQIMAGVIIQNGSEIGCSTIINTGAIIDHDCKVNENCHIAPGVILNGSVTVDHSSHIGTGSSVVQDIKIGSGCIIAAGSIIYKDIPDNIKIIQQRNEKAEVIL